MAERRMFAKKIVDSDAFLDMPLTTQALYFHLAMRADDDGFVNAPQRILRLVGCSQDDYRLLVAKRFLLGFESGVVVVKHWFIHNYIQKDRYTPTTYLEEKSELRLDENKAYTEQKSTMDTRCIQDGYKSDTQVRLGKVSIENLSQSAGAHTCEEETQKSISEFKSKTGIDAFFIEGIDYKALADKISESDYLQGVTSFWWLVSNYHKVMKDAYKNHKPKEAPKRDKNSIHFANERSYTKEELAGMITDVDEIDI